VCSKDESMVINHCMKLIEFGYLISCPVLPKKAIYKIDKLDPRRNKKNS